MAVLHGRSSLSAAPIPRRHSRTATFSREHGVDPGRDQQAAVSFKEVRQGEIAEKFANVTEAVRKHHKKNRLNGTRRPKSLLSGLVFCGCCGGSYSLRGADRFACSNHISKGACSNSRTIPREELEARVLSGLKDRMMAPEIVEETMRAYAEETNRLNRERRSSGDAWKAELVKIEKQIHSIIEAIKAGMFHESMKAEMDTLEVRKIELTALLADAPEDTPDITTHSFTYSQQLGIQRTGSRWPPKTSGLQHAGPYATR